MFFKWFQKKKVLEFIFFERERLRKLRYLHDDFFLLPRQTLEKKRLEISSRENLY